MWREGPLLMTKLKKKAILHLSDQGTFYSRYSPEKTTFPPEFCNEICNIIWTGHKKITILQKIFKCCTVSKWRPNNRFLFRVISILAKFWKTTFPEEFFNEIWLKEGEYE